MDNTLLLHILIAGHTLIGAVNIACLFYLPYAAVKGHSPAKNRLLQAALVLPLVNLVLLAANGWVCPLQDWAQALSGSREGWVRDILWVPESWLRVVPYTFSIGYLIGAGLVFGLPLVTLRGPARHAEERAKRASKRAPGTSG